jgi:hypothetical protein
MAAIVAAIHASLSFACVEAIKNVIDGRNGKVIGVPEGSMRLRFLRR